MTNQKDEIFEQMGAVMHLCVKWRHATDRIDQIRLEVNLASAVDEMERIIRKYRECSEGPAEIH